jgi:serine/threonine protein kinase/Tol biopolymer transport system component
MLLPAGTRIGPYEITGLLGEGGMGEVYRAVDTNLGRAVAVKVLPESFAHDSERRARFQREAQILATLNHPHIATIYGWEVSAGRPALIMELVDGKPLNEQIPRGGIALAKTLKYAAQITAGLEAAHRAGIVHRDLKPSNVMITAAGNVKLLDFGLAKLADSASPLAGGEATRTLAHTEEGTIVGTVAYMSPEQAQGQEVDGRSDIFSFGAVLYEMLTGRRAFERENTASTLAAILRDEPKPISEVTTVPLPRDLENTLRRCLRKDPERRFQTASDLRVALQDLQEDLSSGLLQAAVATPGRARSRWVMWAGLGAVGILLAGGFWWQRSRHTAAPVSLHQQTFEGGMALMPTLSPDGKMLVYASDRSGEGGLDLWVKQVAGGNAVRLVSGMGSLSIPQFSADGTGVYYLGPQYEILSVSTLGGPSRKLVDSAGPFSLSSRGEIVFTRSAGGAAGFPMQIVSPGGAPVRWQPACTAIITPAWSPDGRQVAFGGFCNNEFGIFVAPREGGSPQKLRSNNLSLNVRVGQDGLLFGSQMFWYRLGDGREGLVFPWRHGDAVNLYQLSLDGKGRPLTQGTGWESWPSVSSSGQVAFTRAEFAHTIWSLPLMARGNDRPHREAAAATMFGLSRDGARLVFGRMLGPGKGEVVSRDTATGAETTLAVHEGIVPIGSLWVTVALDGSQAAYRVSKPSGPEHYVISTSGGTPRMLESMKGFNLVSDWFPDGRRILGECFPTTAGLCAADIATGTVTKLLRDAEGELLYPSWSWDGKWLTFMRRRAGNTVICATPVRDGGAFGEEADWVQVSPDGGSAARPRFAPDGNSIFYLFTQKGVLTLVRQELDPATKQPRGEPVSLEPVQVFPASIANLIGASNSVVGVSRTRVFYNSTEVRSNVWMTSIE